MKIQKLRDAPEHETCVRCDGLGPSLAHYTGRRQLAYGKGTAIKGHDAIGAHLCDPCHKYFDGYEDDNDAERSEEFLHLVALTIIRVIHRKILK